MTKFIKTLSIFCLIIPVLTQAQVRHELRECDHEITREKREARREVRHADSRYEARQERREGQREVARERAECRREVNKAVYFSHPQPHFGRFIHGVHLGAIIIAPGIGRAPPAPHPSLCWNWKDQRHYDGYWYYCKAPY